MVNYFKIAKFFLYLVPLAVFIVTPSTLFPFIVGKYVFFRTAVGLALIFFLLGLLFQSKEVRPPKINGQSWGGRTSQILKSPLVIAVSIFVLIFVLAGFFGVDPAWSFWSNFERGEGSLQLLCFGVFFLLMVLLFKEEKNWRIMFWISIIAAGLMIFYGVGAGLKYFDAETAIRNIDGIPQKILTGKGGQLYQTFKSFIGPDFRDEGYRFAGSIGNPAYVSVYLIFALFYGFYLLFSKYKQRIKSFGGIGLIVLAVFFSAFFFLSATRGAFIGLIAAILMAFLYLGFSIKTWRKWLLGAGVVALLAVGLLIFFRNTPFIKSLPGSRIFDISFQTENFQNRMVIWQIAIDGFKERPLLGWGPENFSYTFDKHYNPKHFSIVSGFGAWYDRAHNVFLDYLNQAGILGLLSFLGIFIAFYWQFFKTRTLADFDKTRTMADNNSKLLYEDITYKIRGAIFDVKKQLGLGHKEFIYQNALEEEFNKRGIIFEREKPLDVMYNNKKVGVYKPDFIIENKIILELKSLPFLGRNEKKQIWHYLRGLPYQLALLVNFGQKNDVQIERIIYAPDLLSQSAKSAVGPFKSVSISQSAKSVLSPLESALLVALPIAYLVQGIVLFDILPTYINLFLFLAFATYKLKAENKI